ncbi:hypothetical protein BCR39DRAFT_345854 [Naematelia encephala]|uniref:Uncharacterized protein n=1 Tax=Naematelia encephala TaxID=71784 RepID=A0A1Y2AM10_9TREE|nr:hypothetical protein BCR39DRAFT_345854 [Naematelia encephala]
MSDPLPQFPALYLASVAKYCLSCKSLTIFIVLVSNAVFSRLGTTEKALRRRICLGNRRECVLRGTPCRTR